MNIKQIRELAQIVQANGLSELEIEEGEVRIRLSRAQAVPQGFVAAMPQEMPISAPMSAPISEEPGVDFNRSTSVKSSLIGVFYAAASPGATPFVSVGSKVNKGDVLCIIEAMKLMNEIVAEQSGEIVDICVNDGDLVEYGQTLFKLC